MGMLQRRSVFVNDEPKGEPSFKKSRGRKVSMPSSKRPVIDKEEKELPKRKSFVNILRPWKKDNNAGAPVPALPLSDTPYAHGRGSVATSPTSPISPFPPRPGSHFGSQAGICSTFPRPAYPSSVTLPNFLPGRRVYNGGGAADSTSSFGASRSTLYLSAGYPSYAHYPPSPALPMTISSPIPGIGDVPPTRYNDFQAPPPAAAPLVPSVPPTPGEIGVALTSQEAASLGKRESRQRIRLSTQTTHTVTTSSTHTSHTSHTVLSSTSQTALSSTSPSSSQHSDGHSPLASNRQSTVTIKPLKRQSKGSKRASEADFLLDAEVAAAFSGSALALSDEIPPVPGIPAALAALEGRKPDDRSPEPRSRIPEPRERILEPRETEAEREQQHKRSPRAVVSMRPEPRKSKIPVPQPRIHSMLPVPPARRSSAMSAKSEKSLPPPPRQSFASLRPPPRAVDSSGLRANSTSPRTRSPGTSAERFPAPASPRPDSLLSTASWGSSASNLLSGRPGRVERGSLPWRESPGGTPDLSTGSESEGVEALEDKKITCVRMGDDESLRSSSSLSHCPTGLLSPVSSACDRPLSPPTNRVRLHSPSISSDFGLGLGTIVPGPRKASPTREIAGLKSRNSVLEVTNSRLEAELRQARSNPGLRSALTTSMCSISSMAIRDDLSVRWSSHNGSCLDLAMPALVAEIDELKRSSVALQAQLTGLKSQVSLLLPPTPHELAETEVRDGYVHGEMYIPSASYAPPASSRVVPGARGFVSDADADDERETPNPRRQDCVSSDFEASVSATSHSSAYSISSLDSSSPLTPDTSANWPAMLSMTELKLDSKAGDRSSVVSMTRGGAPLTKLPARGAVRARSRIAPVNVTIANTCAPGSDPTTPKARRAQRNSLQPTPRSAVTPRSTVFNMGTAVPPPRPPRRRPVNVPREIVDVAAG
ncbi:hypothetical protein CspeluHIS016_0100090 [Cutaneotrichosporon spelunceum]|uniref:Uncharacterized protein n=1 Tax=Cutaneotrichosporon spelunceum TaxID=1672016 RepID=A0AAD3Y8T0_9TREE|nr:hypothetical protein CspeluHIS016_0100090 [Cutaneotrichosporon spelunceum]